MKTFVVSCSLASTSASNIFDSSPRLSSLMTTSFDDLKAALSLQAAALAKFRIEEHHFQSKKFENIRLNANGMTDTVIESDSLEKLYNDIMDFSCSNDDSSFRLGTRSCGSSVFETLSDQMFDDLMNYIDSNGLSLSIKDSPAKHDHPFSGICMRDSLTPSQLNIAIKFVHTADHQHCFHGVFSKSKLIGLNKLLSILNDATDFDGINFTNHCSDSHADHSDCPHAPLPLTIPYLGFISILDSIYLGAPILDGMSTEESLVLLQQMDKVMTRSQMLKISFDDLQKTSIHNLFMTVPELNFSLCTIFISLFSSLFLDKYRLNIYENSQQDDTITTHYQTAKSLLNLRCPLYGQEGFFLPELSQILARELKVTFKNIFAEPAEMNVMINPETYPDVSALDIFFPEYKVSSFVSNAVSPFVSARINEGELKELMNMFLTLSPTRLSIQRELDEQGDDNNLDKTLNSFAEQLAIHMNAEAYASMLERNSFLSHKILSNKPLTVTSGEKYLQAISNRIANPSSKFADEEIEAVVMNDEVYSNIKSQKSDLISSVACTTYTKGNGAWIRMLSKSSPAIAQKSLTVFSSVTDDIQKFQLCPSQTKSPVSMLLAALSIKEKAKKDVHKNTSFLMGLLIDSLENVCNTELINVLLGQFSAEEVSSSLNSAHIRSCPIGLLLNRVNKVCDVNTKKENLRDIFFFRKFADSNQSFLDLVRASKSDAAEEILTDFRDIIKGGDTKNFDIEMRM